MGTASTTAKGKGKSLMRPRLMFAHSNEDGTGSAIQVELHPATLERSGSLMIEFADQTDAGYVDSDGYHNGGFNWAGSLKFRLKLSIVGRLLMVLTGETDCIGENGENTVEIRRKNDNVRFGCVPHYEESRYGIALTAQSDGTNCKIYSFRLKPEEILILNNAIWSSMGILAWGEGAAE